MKMGLVDVPTTRGSRIAGRRAVVPPRKNPGSRGVMYVYVQPSRSQAHKVHRIVEFSATSAFRRLRVLCKFLGVGAVLLVLKMGECGFPLVKWWFGGVGFGGKRRGGGIENSRCRHRRQAN